MSLVSEWGDILTRTTYLRVYETALLPQGHFTDVSMINGGDPFRFSDDPHYHTTVGNPAPYVRNGYVKIEQGASDPIRFVEIYNGGGDLIWVDHIAIEYVGVPEPSTVGLTIFGALLWAALHRRRNGDAVTRFVY